MRLTLARAAKYHAMRVGSRKGNRMKIASLALASLAFCAQPLAQEPNRGVAQLKDIHGNVLVSHESGLGAGREALRLVRGTRVLTTTKSDVTVVYDDGCEVKLKENERFEVETGKPCAVLAALPQSILSTPVGTAATATAGTAAAFAATLPAIGGAAAALNALRVWRESQPVSPS